MSRTVLAEATEVPLPRRLLVMLTVAGAFLAGQPGAPAHAQAAPSESATNEAHAEPDGGPRLPPLAPAKADEEGRRRALISVREAERSVVNAKRKVAGLKRTIPAVDRELAAAQARLSEVRDREARAAVVLAEARDRLRGLAVASYVSGGSTPQLTYLLQSDGGDDLSRRTALVGSAAKMQRDAVTAYEAAREAATTEVVDANIAVQEITARRARILAELASADDAVREGEAEVAHRRLLLDLVSAAAPALPTDIPRLVLDAYQRAILAMSVRMPTCRIPWPAVAALGRIESNHGRYRGARFALNGDVYPPIIGIPLDGTNKTREIRDTDDGLYDGDTVYDRAVGPMQFIPSTWTRMGLDGDGDGIANPNNIYDATLSAAHYLCRAVPGGQLDNEESLAKAYFSYNRSSSYVEAGLALFRIYGEQAGRIRA